MREDGNRITLITTDIIKKKEKKKRNRAKSRLLFRYAPRLPRRCDLSSCFLGGAFCPSVHPSFSLGHNRLSVIACEFQPRDSEKIAETDF